MNINPPHGTNNKTMKETIKTKADLYEFNNALLNAVNSAAMLDDTPDGGTCNLDSVTVKISIPANLAAQTWVRLEKMLARDCGRMWKGYYMVDIPLSGQGNRRTRMTEAACKSLKSAGYNAAMFYQID